MHRSVLELSFLYHANHNNISCFAYSVIVSLIPQVIVYSNTMFSSILKGSFQGQKQNVKYAYVLTTSVHILLVFKRRLLILFLLTPQFT